MLVLIDDTIYEVIDKQDNDVCVLQTFDYADGYQRQLKIWTRNYTEVIYDNGITVKFKEEK